MNNGSSPFKSPQGEAQFMAVYDSLMQQRHVNYETFGIPAASGAPIG
jgi:hypothetical protein